MSNPEAKTEPCYYFCGSAEQQCYRIPAPVLDLRVEVEECLNRELQLRLNLFPAAFQDVHGDLRLVAILQLHRSRLHGSHLVRG